MFYLKDGVAWIKARCYHSQKKHDAMHEVKVAITSEYTCHVTNAVCSCVAGIAGVCSHVIGLLKQIIHYVMMKFKAVPDVHKYNKHGINLGLSTLKQSQ